MINCSKCNSSVNFAMKHSISNNECPYCGSQLIENSKLKKCKEISKKLIDAGFSQNIFELSIFIANNYIEDGESDAVQKNALIETVNDKVSGVENAEPEDEFNYDKALEYEENEEEDDKISRLRKMAKNNPILNKKGPSVRRVSSI